MDSKLALNFRLAHTRGAWSLHSKDFLFFCGQHFVDAFHVFVVDFLHRSFGVFLYILGHAFLDGFLKAFDGIAASISYRNLCLFGFAFRLLNQGLAAVLGERRNADTDNLAVVFGSDSEVGIDDGTLNFLEHRFFPWGDCEGACIGNRYVCNI